MLKILLMSLNAKYIHTNLAIRSIEQYFLQNGKGQIVVNEFTINNQMDEVLSSVYEGDYDVIFASTYIWNIEPLKLIFENLKAILPNVKIYLGGPEVTYNPLEQLEKMPYIEGILSGEGEQLFLEVVEALNSGGITQPILGLYTRLFQGDPQKRPLLNLDELPFPYKDLSAFNHRILYYESSRGCPYNCSYCLSSASKGVRFKSLTYVFSDLLIFLKVCVPQVKFVDRTFNIRKEHALSIIRFIVENDNGITNFHFEINADLLDDDFIDLVAAGRKGLFQFEIGIQTTYDKTMEAIHRPIQFDQLRANTLKLINTQKAHTHVDLIAGLPFESYDRFLTSFDDVYAIGAEQLQLGFLKLLKGTALYNNKELHGYIVRKEPPFEVLSNHYMEYRDFCDLKRIESLIEYYHNSRKFVQSLKHALAFSRLKPSAFFNKMKSFWLENGYFNGPVATYRLYEIFLEFSKTLDIDSELVRDLLKFDYYFANLKGQKELFHYDHDARFNARRLAFLNDEKYVLKYFPQYLGLTGKAILKHIECVSFRYSVMDENPIESPNIVLFHYVQGSEAHAMRINYETEWSNL